MTERVHTHTHCFCFFPDPQKPQVCLEPWVWISMAGPQWVYKKHHQPDQCCPLPESPPTPNHIHWVRRTPSLSIPSLAGPTMNPILLSCSQCLNSRPLRPRLLSVLFTATPAPCSFPSSLPLPQLALAKSEWGFLPSQPWRPAGQGLLCICLVLLSEAFLPMCVACLMSPVSHV